MKKSRNEITVGFFVVVGFIILATTVFFVSGVYVFRQGIELNVMYDYVSILDKGAPVRMAGVRVGEVNKVELTRDMDADKLRVRVKLFIEKGVEIRENYMFLIRGTHILSEPHIEISPEKGESPLLQDGATLNGVTPVPIEDLIGRGHQIAANLDEIFKSLRGAVQDEQSGEAIRGILTNLASLTQSLEVVFSGSEADLKKAIGNIEASSQSLRSVMSQLDSGDGTIGKLLTEDQLYEDLRAFVEDIKAHPWKLFKQTSDNRKDLKLYS